MTLPEVIPIFPLPNVVLFPRMLLPLHVFEARYREMVRDAARGARLIGMALLRDGWALDYQGRPPVFAVGTVGEMVHLEELPDGRSNIMLRGLRAYAIEQEVDRGTAYRQVRVAWRDSPADRLAAGVREAIGALARRCIERQGGTVGKQLLEDSVDDEVFVNFFAQHLDVAPLEKQALLEAATLAERAKRLTDALEFRLQELRLNPGGTPGRTH
jgi:hypothetical protein